MAERRFTLLFYTAVATAAIATFGVYRVLKKTQDESRVETRSVVVAAREMREGEIVDRLGLSVAQWPAQAVPVGAFASPDSVIGRVTKVTVFPGEPIVPGRLAPPGTGPGLAVKITPGKRAMAVKINDVAGISGLVQPDSRVDVLVTLKEENKQDRQVAKLFMTNMRVLSVGTQVQPGDDGKPVEGNTATLEVTPEESERLAVAMNQGSIQLVLRGYGDPDSVQTAGARSGDVLAQLRSAPDVRPPAPASAQRRVAARRPSPRPANGTQSAVAKAPDRPDSAVVQVYRGNKVSQQKFEKSDSTAQQP
jgi:pilus assembly protein CpaB